PQRRPDDLGDAPRGAERHHFLLRASPEQRILRLARDEALAAGDGEGALDLVRRPFAEADVAGLALAHDVAQRLHGLLDPRRRIVAMALVEVDMVDAQAFQ